MVVNVLKVYPVGMLCFMSTRVFCSVDMLEEKIGKGYIKKPIRADEFHPHKLICNFTIKIVIMMSAMVRSTHHLYKIKTLV